MDSSGRMVIALSRQYREDDWRQADAWRRASSESPQARPVSTSKRLLLLLGAAILALIAFAPSVAASPRSGDLQITKECSEYTGQAGSFCTFVSSNIRAIPAGARIYYASAAGPTSLDTDVTIVAGPGNIATGHCTLDFLALPGRCTFSGGTGQFTHFQAWAAVSVDGSDLWHWDGAFSFSPRD
jgi:hypothetical protein